MIFSFLLSKSQLYKRLTYFYFENDSCKNQFFSVLFILIIIIKTDFYTNNIEQFKYSSIFAKMFFYLWNTFFFLCLPIILNSIPNTSLSSTKTSRSFMSTPIEDIHCITIISGNTKGWLENRMFVFYLVRVHNCRLYIKRSLRLELSNHFQMTNFIIIYSFLSELVRSRAVQRLQLNGDRESRSIFQIYWKWFVTIL